MSIKDKLELYLHVIQLRTETYIPLETNVAYWRWTDREGSDCAMIFSFLNWNDFVGTFVLHIVSPS